MVTDHQTKALSSADRSSADARPNDEELKTADRITGTHQSHLSCYCYFQSSQLSATISAVIMLAICCGCQSGIVDPGRTRGRPQQTLSPEIVTPQTNATQFNSAQPPVSGPITQGATPPDWAHVARQPATSVIQMAPTGEDKSQYHSVKPGESWTSLARTHGLTVKQLADANGMDPAAILKQGQIVYIPEVGRRAATP
jgi:LysM repeat protein